VFSLLFLSWQLLQHRLARRSVTVSATLDAGALTQPGIIAAVSPVPLQNNAAVPSVAITNAVEAAMLMIASPSSTDVLTASVAALVKGAAKTMFLSKIEDGHRASPHPCDRDGRRNFWSASTGSTPASGGNTGKINRDKASERGVPEEQTTAFGFARQPTPRGSAGAVGDGADASRRPSEISSLFSRRQNSDLWQ
jgi:hypothetical protein